MDNEKFLQLVQPYAVEDEVRVGSEFDGGYLIPLRILSQSSYLLSFGYGHNWDFEKSFTRLDGERFCWLFDSSINLQTNIQAVLKSFWAFIRRNPEMPLKRLLDTYNYVQLRVAGNVQYFHKEVRKTKMLSSQISFFECRGLVPDESRSIFKIDIEGCEYEILDDATSLESFAALIIEFHDVSINLHRIEDFLRQISKTHVVTHCHFNNNAISLTGQGTEVVEITLCRKDFFFPGELSAKKSSLPISLDSPCNPSLLEVNVKFIKN